ncbi:MAG: metallophosphoesterase [Ruminococcus sp.]|nr:metallophosphoesterase [Ruminococcus sp.]
MSLWLGLFAFVIILSILGLFFLISRARRFGFVKRIAEKNKLLGMLAALFPIAACLVFRVVNTWAVIIVLLHLVIIWAICDLVAFIIRRIKKNDPAERYVTGWVAIGLTVVYMSYGWFCAHHVFETDYSFKTDKPLPEGGLRVVEIADLHLGITLDGDEFKEQCARVNETKPDIVMICGDFVDDDSEKEDMIKACDALGTLETKYGVYWIYGNHDRGYYEYRDFSSQDLMENLERNNVKILRDETVLIDDTFYVVGREDRSAGDRKEAQDLTRDLDKSKYIIMLDHQPNDYKNETEAEADLVLSGHTHGGHIFPAGPVGLLMGANDRIYGTERREGTDFLVTSGISGWAIPFKTATISEFVVIDISN